MAKILTRKWVNSVWEGKNRPHGQYYTATSLGSSLYDGRIFPGEKKRWVAITAPLSDKVNPEGLFRVPRKTLTGVL